MFRAKKNPDTQAHPREQPEEFAATHGKHECKDGQKEEFKRVANPYEARE